jgi:protein TonB
MRWFMLPVSIGAHVIAAVALLIVPLAAEVEWPSPAPLHPMLLTTVVPVPAAVVALAPPRRVVEASSFTAPGFIAPERESHPEPGVAADAVASPGESVSVDAGLPGGFGAALSVSVPQAPETRRASPQVPLRVGQGVREPRKILDVTPLYPAIAVSARVQGAVILEAVINERGAVERVKVLRSVPLLDGAAMDAVSRWRYTPTLLNGTPVAVLMTITINFTLNK